MVFGRVETESLINEVEKREILWNHSGEHYYDKARKQKAWTEVCVVLFTDFKSMDEARKKVVLRDVMSRWRTIRDNYVRKRKKFTIVQKSGPRKKKIKKYIYDEQLSFLKRVLGRRPSSCSSSNSNSQQEDSHYSEFEDTKEGILEQCISEPSLLTQSLPDQSLTNQSMSSSLGVQSPKSQTESPSPIEDKVMEFIEHHQLSKIRTYDEDMSFFLSLLPSVKRLNTMEKFDFRMQTMRLLQDHLKQYTKNSPRKKLSADFHFAELSTSDREFLPEND